MFLTAEERSRRIRMIWCVIFLVAPPFFAYTAADESKASIPIRLAAGAAGLAVGLGIAWLIRPAPAFSAPPGTRVFEAYHTAALLERAINDRRVELRSIRDTAQRAHLEREIPFLEAQLQENRAIVAANDRSPGRGWIGYEPFQGA